MTQRKLSGIVHTPPAPIKGCPDILATARHTFDQSIRVEYLLGEDDAELGFQKDPMIPEITRRMNAPEYVEFIKFVKDRGRPEALEHEYRWADLFAWLDAVGWEPKPRDWQPPENVEA